MTTEPNGSEQQKTIVIQRGGGSNAVYGIGMIGAWVYYLKRATTNKERVMGVLKGFAWPALLVYEALKLLNKE